MGGVVRLRTRRGSVAQFCTPPECDCPARSRGRCTVYRGWSTPAPIRGLSEPTLGFLVCRDSCDGPTRCPRT